MRTKFGYGFNSPNKVCKCLRCRSLTLPFGVQVKWVLAMVKFSARATSRPGFQVPGPVFSGVSGSFGSKRTACNSVKGRRENMARPKSWLPGEYPSLISRLKCWLVRQVGRNKWLEYNWSFNLG